MIETFDGNYSYNMEFDVSQKQLEAIKKRHDESFVEFLMRWNKRVTVISG